MFPLPTQRRVLIWLCLYPPDEGTNVYQRNMHYVFASSTFGTMTMCLLGSVKYFYEFISIDLEESLYALYIAAATAGVIYMLIVGFLSKHKMVEIFNELAQIYDTSKNIGQLLSKKNDYHINRMEIKVNSKSLLLYSE